MKKIKNISKIILIKIRNFFKRFFIFSNTASTNKSDYFYIRVSNGCFGRCSYCAIKKAIGNLRSKSIEQCIFEFKKGLEQGYTRFMLVGDDVGGYGLDIGLNFPHLLNELLAIPGNYTLHLGETHPKWINLYFEELSRLFLSKKINHAIIPIQSGSKKILRSMYRDENIKKTRLFLTNLLKLRPDFKIETHLIIGYPGETQKDIKQTLDFIKPIKFIAVWLYRFQGKYGTVAYDLPNQVSEKIKDRRIKQIQTFLVKNKINSNPEV